jgi:hypothetical protein
VDALRSFLRERPEIQTVIVTGWWHRYATGSSYRGQKAIWQDRGCHDDPEPVCVAGSLSRSLNRLLKEFSDIRFVLLDDVPVGWDLHPKSYLRAEFTGRNAGVAALPYMEAQDQFNDYAGILHDVASNNPNATFSPLLFESLCDAEGCSIVDDRGGLLYSDGDHLSSYGALSLKNEIRTMFLEDVLGQ